MTVVLLCCAAGAAAGEPPPDARLQEAQKAFAEATTLNEAGKYTEAVAQVERALELREALLGGTHPEVADCLDLLGRLYLRQGNIDRAEPLLRRGLVIREAALGGKHPDVASSLNNLANL
jgi:tetratricopeptide (TPR) repeat protein